MKKYFRFGLLPACIALSLTLTAPGLLIGNPSPSAPSSIVEEEADVVILGGGIGGLTSAVYLARSGLKPIVIEGQQPGGQITQSLGIQNWPGEKEISGNLLTERARKQAEESGAIILREEAVKVDFTTTPFKITLRNLWKPSKSGQLKILRAKTCIIATGAIPNKLGVPGEGKFWSKGVHTCATCDGSLYKGEHVAIVGGGDGAIVEAHHIAKLASKVTLIVRGKFLKSIEEKRKQNLISLPNVEILYGTQIKEIDGNPDGLTHLVLTQNGEERILPVDALFLAIGTKPNTDLFRGQLALDSKGYIELGKDQSTSVPGVFAIGDVSDSFYRQAVTAAGDGAKAALQAESFLAGGKIEPATAKIAYHNAKEVVINKRGEPNIVQVKNEASVLHIKSIEQFQSEVLESSIPVVVDFYADWCGPCRALSPHIDEWSKEFQGKLKFAKVNVDHMQKLAKRYRVDALPTVLYFEKQGKLKERCTGQDEIAELISNLEGSYGAAAAK